MSGKPDVGAVFDHWRSVWNHPQAKLDPKRKKAIESALKLGYSPDHLCEAISGYQNSSHHTGQNERQTVYDDISLMLRDAAHIDAGLRFHRQPPANLPPKLIKQGGHTQAWLEKHEEIT